jgi:hypothetical protein
MIVKQSDGWYLFSHTGHRLGGPYPTREHAVKQEEAIHAHERRARGTGSATSGGRGQYRDYRPRPASPVASAIASCRRGKTGLFRPGPIDTPEMRACVRERLEAEGINPEEPLVGLGVFRVRRGKREEPRGTSGERGGYGYAQERKTSCGCGGGYGYAQERKTSCGCGGGYGCARKTSGRRCSANEGEDLYGYGRESGYNTILNY